MGEVRFLRAMYLFLLVQQWGPIPYHLVPSSGSEKEMAEAACFKSI